MSDNLLNHNLNIINRERLEATSIFDVVSLSDTEVEAEYADGCLAIDGDGLKIEEFSSETGKLTVIGKINGVCYYNKIKIAKKGIFRR